MYSRSTSFRHYVMALILLLLSVLVIPRTLAQSENVCRESYVQTIEYGDRITGEIDDDYFLGPVALYCFEAERGDSVTIIVEPTVDTGNLIPVIYITEPILESTDEPLGINGATVPLGDVEVVIDIDADGTYLIVVQGDQGTQGVFDLILEVEEGQSLLGSDNSGGGDETASESPNDSSTSPDDIVLGETNLCSLEEMNFLDYDERVTDVLTPNLPQALFCLEGNQGDIIQLRVGTASGELVTFVLLGNPFFDGTADTIFAQDVASSRSDTAQITYELQQDGSYFVLIGPADNGLGEFFVELTLVDEETASLGCQNEPLSSLSQYPWVITSADNAEAAITVNVTCAGLIIVDVLGASFISEYDFNQDDALTFVLGDEEFMGNTEFTTVSVDENSWVLENGDSETITLERLNVEACDDPLLSEMTVGLWVNNDDGSLLAFEFMCNAVALILIDNQILIEDYALVDGGLVISPNSPEETLLGQIEFDGGELVLVQDGRELRFSNSIANDEATIDGSSGEDEATTDGSSGEDEATTDSDDD
jgi:hypothetical protein